jgi:hypothetical protein
MIALTNLTSYLFEIIPIRAEIKKIRNDMATCLRAEYINKGNSFFQKVNILFLPVG